MKKVKVTLTVVALLLGVGGAFATKIHTSVKTDTGIFYVNSDGSAGDPVTGTPNCNSSQNLCAAEYNIVDGQPTDQTGDHQTLGDKRP